MSVYGKLSESDLHTQAQAIGGRDQSMRYLVQRSRSAPNFSAAERCPEHEQFGCEARVWSIVERTNPLSVRFDSEARVVKGLLLVVADALNGATAAQVADYDLDAHFARLGLGAYLTASRRNGLRTVVDSVKSAS